MFFGGAVRPLAGHAVHNVDTEPWDGMSTETGLQTDPSLQEAWDKIAGAEVISPIKEVPHGQAVNSSLDKDQSRLEAQYAKFLAETEILKTEIRELRNAQAQLVLDTIQKYVGPHSGRRARPKSQTRPKTANKGTHHQATQTKQDTSPLGSIVKLNVGGTYMETTLKTLTSIPNSTIAKMFSATHSLLKDQNGAYFIDRDPRPFAEILKFLRSPADYRIPTTSADLASAVEIEAVFFGVQAHIYFRPIDTHHEPKMVVDCVKKCAFAGVLRDSEKLWYLHIRWFRDRSLHSSEERQLLYMCKHGCGFGCLAPPYDSEYSVKHFAAGRAIDPAQPKMAAGTMCLQCNKVQ